MVREETDVLTLQADEFTGTEQTTPGEDCHCWKDEAWFEPRCTTAFREE
jgi:hypothetical protein